MTVFGYTLSSDEHPPRTLADDARAAEEVGFGFVPISDAFHPWVSAQGHSPFAWSVLGAVAQATEEMELAVGVTCSLVRIHPAIVAQASATGSEPSEGRFSLGLGTGEALNEHILGHRWPPAPVRLSMPEEAVGIIRALWSRRDRRPSRRLPHGRERSAVRYAPQQPARIGDGYWGHSPDMVGRYLDEGGSGPRYAQLNLCRAEDDAVAKVPCGPDPEPDVDSVRTFLHAGYDHLYRHQIGPDQEGFFRFWHRSLAPALAEPPDISTTQVSTTQISTTQEAETLREAKT